MLVRLVQVGVLHTRRGFATLALSWRTAESQPIGDDQGFGAFEKPAAHATGLVCRGEGLISPARGAAMLGEPLEVVEWQVIGPGVA